MVFSRYLFVRLCTKKSRKYCRFHSPVFQMTLASSSVGGCVLPTDHNWSSGYLSVRLLPFPVNQYWQVNNIFFGGGDGIWDWFVISLVSTGPIPGITFLIFFHWSWILLKRQWKEGQVLYVIWFLVRPLFDFFFKVGKRVGFRTLACVRTSESIKVLTSFRLMRLVPHLCWPSIKWRIRCPPLKQIREEEVKKKTQSDTCFIFRIQLASLVNYFIF